MEKQTGVLQSGPAAWPGKDEPNPPPSLTASVHSPAGTRHHPHSCYRCHSLNHPLTQSPLNHSFSLTHLITHSSTYSIIHYLLLFFTFTHKYYDAYICEKGMNVCRCVWYLCLCVHVCFVLFHLNNHVTALV